MTWQKDETNEKGAAICRGYYDNFVRRIVDSITLGLPVTPMNINDPPITQTPEGLRLVAPPDNDISFIEDQTHIDRISRRHGLQEVLVEGLSDTPDPSYQVDVFQRFLRNMPFLKGAIPFAEIMKWEDFLKEVPAVDYKSEPSLLVATPEPEPKTLMKAPSEPATENPSS
ncbi:MAG: hypothetical protein M1813_006423 [Trichoglossum hirsutum]|nr:MAG: hypothetical protein M1813_007434 [Trichoglossum hirsutum]KAI9859880.1 MAG: hypothetical protein M1813_006423 [Trichoglossum hirsutum]